MRIQLKRGLKEGSKRLNKNMRKEMNNMDYIDLKIKEDLSKTIDEPYSYENSIKKALYRKRNKTLAYFIKKFILLLTSISSMLVGTFSVYAVTGGKIEGIPAMDWLGLKFSDSYIEYKKPVENQVLAFEDTSVELVSTICNEGLTILEFNVKLSEEDYKKLKIGESVLTNEYLEQMNDLKSKTKDRVLNELKGEKYNEEIQKGNYDVDINDIEIPEDEMNERYNEEIDKIDKNIEERKNTLFTIALTLNNEQKGGTYNYDIFNPNMEWYANVYIDDIPYNVTSMQKIERISQYEYRVYNFYLITDDILKDKNDFKITLKNNKLVNMANFKVRILSEKGIEETEQNRSDTWFGYASTLQFEEESNMMKIPQMQELNLPGEFEVNVSKDDILKDSIVLNNPNIKSEFRNISQTVEKVVASPVQTVVKVNHSARKQSSYGLNGNKYINHPEIEYMPLTTKYKVFDSEGKELSCLALTNKRTLIYSDGTREDYDRHDIPNKKFDNAIWETIEYLLIENADSKYIKIIPVEEIKNPVDGKEDDGRPIYYEMDPLIINLN
ncbi:MAG: hypothetical protein Q4D25_10960 [Bacteroidales bacterium]|nr:hypothetical protein [Bacteroidales bacterium]